MELLRTRDPVIPLKPACEVLGVPLATARRHLGPRVHGPRRPRPTSHRKFAEAEEQQVPWPLSGRAPARRWFTEFFEWYANRHRHSGLALFTPADVFFGRVAGLAATRQLALDAAYQAHPERFVRGRPVVRLPPSNVAINPIDPGAPNQTAADVLSAPSSLQPAINVVLPPPPAVVLPGLLQRFVEWIISQLPTLPVLLETARIHAKLTAQLALAGMPIGVADSWIAASAIEHGHGIATRNLREFQRVEGLRLECW